MLISQFDHNLSPYELEALIRARRKGEAADVYIIDVRDDDERTDGRVVPFSVHIPAHNIRDIVEMRSGAFKKKYGFTRPNKNSRILLICSNGRRSNEAAAYLHNYKFTHAVVLSQGYQDWEHLASTTDYGDDL